MEINDLKNKRICLLGLGLENFSLAQYLARHNIKATVLDRRVPKELGDRHKKLKAAAFNFLCGQDYLKHIKNFDIFFKTPGFIGNLRIKKDAVITTPMSLFFDLCPAKIIAITGTKGKGTVASLCYYVLKHCNKKVWLAGNIGIAPFDFIDKLKSDHFVVLELSSFQLLDFKKRPHIAVVTNLFPEHLAPADPINPVFHKNLREYYRAKANIFLNQAKDDWLVVNKNNHHTDKVLQKSKAKIEYFEVNDKLPQSNYLIGEHNLENIAAACAILKILNIPLKVVTQAIENFKGLEHHLEFVAEISGIRFYNDSASTMPQATLAAAKALKEDIILIVGGVNKGYDLRNLAKRLANLRQPIAIILIGKIALKLKRHLKKQKCAFVVYEGGRDINKIVSSAYLLASRSNNKTPIVFSPGFASFDMFKNSKDRGEKFKEAVLSLTHK